MAGQKISDGICSAEVFRKVLARERARADRNDHEFSLVVFDLCRFASGNGQAARLLEFLKTRIRFTDICGWLGQDEIGVILPDTSRAGARAFAASVSAAVRETIIPVGYRIYSYPSLTEDQRQLWFQELIPQRELSRVQNTADGLDQPHTIQRCCAPNERCLFGLTLDECEPPSNGEKHFVDYLPIRRSLAKRIFDVVVSLLALILLAPVMLAIAIAIKLVSPGPLFFRQPRVGFRGRVFTCLKFRTMHVNNNESVHRDHLLSLMHSGSPLTKLDTISDPRVIPFGKFLRATALDELPQLFNVLRGDMSLIGPRPCIPYEYKNFDRWHKKRQETLPGLTGLWQVKGKNRTTFHQMMRFDVSYTQKRNLLLDLKILLLTLPAIAAQVKQDLLAKVRTRNQAAD